MKGILRLFRGLRGYTLIEVAAVVAVTATLAAVAVPVAVDKVKQGKISKAMGDVKGIAAAISDFQKDTGLWPAYDGDNVITVVSQTYFRTLASIDLGGVGTDINFRLPEIDPGVKRWVTTGEIDDVGNHLSVDKPGGDIGGTGARNGVGAATYAAKLYNWKGPYIETIGTDPWNRSYMVNVKGFYDYYSGYGWIISAGPNQILETDVGNNTLQGDDIGMMLYRRPQEDQPEGDRGITTPAVP